MSSKCTRIAVTYKIDVLAILRVEYSFESAIWRFFMRVLFLDDVSPEERKRLRWWRWCRKNSWVWNVRCTNSGDCLVSPTGKLAEHPSPQYHPFDIDWEGRKHGMLDVDRNGGPPRRGDDIASLSCNYGTLTGCPENHGVWRFKLVPGDAHLFRSYFKNRLHETYIARTNYGSSLFFRH